MILTKDHVKQNIYFERIFCADHDWTENRVRYNNKGTSDPCTNIKKYHCTRYLSSIKFINLSKQIHTSLLFNLISLLLCTRWEIFTYDLLRDVCSCSLYLYTYYTYFSDFHERIIKSTGGSVSSVFVLTSCVYTKGLKTTWLHSLLIHGIDWYICRLVIHMRVIRL